MTAAEILVASRGLSIGERRMLGQAMIDEADADAENAPLGDAMVRFLEERIAVYKAYPDQVIPFEVVVAEAEERRKALSRDQPARPPEADG